MKKSNRPLCSGILSMVLFLVLITGAVTACGNSNGKPGTRMTGSAVVSKREKESESDTETSVQDSNDISDWNISEREKDGISYLQISNSGFHGRTSEIEYLTFKVYGSEEDAQKAYREYYDKSKDFDKGRHWEEGDNWFISDEWGVTDASIVWMVCREGNIIISTNLAINGKWIVYGEDQGASQSDAGTSTFKEYILENTEEIIRFVNEELLDE